MLAAVMRVDLFCVGKLKEDYLIRAVEEYRKRLSGLCSLSIVELSEVRLPDQPGRAEIDRALNQEGEKILTAIPRGEAFAALCVEGTQMSSEAFADFFRTRAVQGASRFGFVIGGSYGLSGQVKRQATLRLSLSEMTFPHHLARVLLLEQIYRAFTIQAGIRYHK